jgi:hypothetical protein
MIVVSQGHNNTSARSGSRRCEWVMCMCVCVCVCVRVTMYTHDDGSAAQECVFLRAQGASLRHTAAGIPQGGGGACGGGGEVAGWLG